jgi:hypothetical protein
MNNGPVQQLYISIPYGQGHTHEIIYGMQVNKITNHKTRVNFFPCSNLDLIPYSGNRHRFLLSLHSSKSLGLPISYNRRHVVTTK